MSQRRPDVELALLGAYLLALPFMWFGSVTILGQLVIVADWLFVALAVIVGLRCLREPPVPGRWHLSLGLYVGAMLLSAAFSGDPATGLRKGVSVVYLAAVAAVTHAALTRRSVETPEDSATPDRVDAGLTAWVLSTAFAVTMGLLGVVGFYAGLTEQPANPFVRGYGSLPPGAYPRVAALFVNINMYCGFLIVGAAATWLAWYRRPEHRGYPLLLVGILTAAAFTFSPGIGALAVAVALLATALPVPPFASLSAHGAHGGTVPIPTRPWTGATATLTTAIVATMLLAASLSPAALARGELAPSVRWSTWGAATRTFVANPVFGVGLGQDTVDVRYEVASGDIQHLRDAHSTPLNVAAQAGIVGFAALVTVLASTLCGLLRSREPRALALAIAVLATWGVHGLTGSFEDSRHLWALLGVAAAAADSAAERVRRVTASSSRSAEPSTAATGP